MNNPLIFWIFAFVLWMIIAASVCLNKKNNGLIDILWGLGFVILSGTSFAVQNHHSLQSLLITTLVWIWGLRLSIYLYLRNWNKPEDFRPAGLINMFCDYWFSSRWHFVNDGGIEVAIKRHGQCTRYRCSCHDKNMRGYNIFIPQFCSLSNPEPMLLDRKNTRLNSSH